MMNFIKCSCVILVVGVVSFACSKQGKLKLFNGITIQNITTTYNVASDCDSASQGTYFTFTISFSNPNDENIIYVEYDRIKPVNIGQFSYDLDINSINNSTIEVATCRRFYGDEYLDMRFFIVTKDEQNNELRSQPYSFQLDNPSK